MTQTGNCPKCGAPVWSMPKPGDPQAVPETVFSCPCHKFLQLPEFKPAQFIPYYVPQPYVPSPIIPWEPSFIYYGNTAEQHPIQATSGYLQFKDV